MFKQSKKVKSKPAAASAGKKGAAVKRVYFFGNGKAEGGAHLKDLLGGKGANLAEMTRMGLPVPPGFTITTEACQEYLHTGIMPGIEARAPERTETSSGSRASPKRLRITFSMCAIPAATSLSSPGGYFSFTGS